MILWSHSLPCCTSKKKEVIIIFLGKNNKIKILKLFFDAPEKSFYIREMSRITKLSAPSVINIISSLSREGLLISERSRITKNVHASKSDKFLQLKKFFNLYSILESGLIDVLRKNYEEPEAIVLFGSYSRGEDISKSDIDIAVITNKRTQVDTKEFESQLKRKINVHEVKISHAEKEFLNTLSNGIVLYGYLKVL